MASKTKTGNLRLISLGRIFMFLASAIAIAYGAGSAKLTRPQAGEIIRKAFFTGATARNLRLQTGLVF
jgi:hypothetical protein